MNAAPTPALKVAKWKDGRSWAVYDQSGALVVVALYKRGAEEVARRLSALGEPPPPSARTFTGDIIPRAYA